MSDTFNQVVEICKVNEMKRIVYGKVLVPDKVDSQGDIVTREEIENAAHNFLISIQKAYKELVETGRQVTKAGEIGFMHTVFKGVGNIGYVVESWIDDDGSWMLGTKITDDRIWQMILDGKIKGYSIGGVGRRIPVEE